MQTSSCRSLQTARGGYRLEQGGKSTRGRRQPANKHVRHLVSADSGRTREDNPIYPCLLALEAEPEAPTGFFLSESQVLIGSEGKTGFRPIFSRVSTLLNKEGNVPS
ncbi:hypothetical protein PoB_007562500 [Plakobranchus ocellatus]|uniref:Uncharacterized protein n=1 Tax=Plakobranchus ocellatus TaxID=259542 RepID=A0AAV4DY44_9GAST|nr:hypothetical protein PoB_007562500 [Plakobranchus ocellatus]